MLSYILLGYLLGFTAMTGIYARSVRMRQAEEALNAGVMVDVAEIRLLTERRP